MQSIKIKDLFQFSVYGKVNVALEDLEPEIVCVNLRTGKAEGMGVINSPTYSYSIIVNLQAARKALSSECCLAKGKKRSTLTKIISYSRTRRAISI